MKKHQKIHVKVSNLSGVETSASKLIRYPFFTLSQHGTRSHDTPIILAK